MIISSYQRTDRSFPNMNLLHHLRGKRYKRTGSSMQSAQKFYLWS